MSRGNYELLPRSRYTTSTRFPIKLRTIFLVSKFAIPAVFLLLFWGLYNLYFYEPQLKIFFYDRSWRYKTIDPIPPLAGCFDQARVSPRYNVSEFAYGTKRNEVQTGIPLRLGLDCYNFAGTIKQDPRTGRMDQSISAEHRTQFHTYWRVDLAPFGLQQEWMLKSFFATQDVSSSRLTIWTNGDLNSNKILQTYLKRYPDSFAVNVVDIPSLAKGTELEGSDLLMMKDSKAWIDGDLIRLLLLWNYGGVWVDMDFLLTRDLEPLLEHEFVTQWYCHDKSHLTPNGALMRFRQHSPYLCEAFHVMATSKPPRSGSTDWGALLYSKLWRRLIAASIPPFRILPSCFSGGQTCRLDNNIPDPLVPDNSRGKWTMGLGLEEDGGLDQVLHKIFGVHVQNRWGKPYPSGGWVERLLLRRYDIELGK